MSRWVSTGVLYGEWVEKDKGRVVVTENKERFQRLQET